MKRIHLESGQTPYRLPHFRISVAFLSCLLKIPIVCLSTCIFLCGQLFAQIVPDTTFCYPSSDTLTAEMEEIVISASRIPESIFKSAVSIQQLTAENGEKSGAATVFEALEHEKGVQIISPGLGFKVINTRGFANTTNVRFTQLIDGIDNQAPHIGAPIANALGASDTDINKIEIIPGTASALYGMNAINGLANIRTKNPFSSPGLTVRQLTGINHLGNKYGQPQQVYSQSHIRYAAILTKSVAVKLNISYTNGLDWAADNRDDLAASLNTSTGLTGNNNPAYDEVNSYGNESSNRKTLTLNGKKYIVSRTGYREASIADYSIENLKSDIGLYFRPAKQCELSLSVKGALINTIYQRSNRFRLEDYTLRQYAISYVSPLLEFRTYVTAENTGHSYNLRSLSENMDRAFKKDSDWFADYTSAFNAAVAMGSAVATAHQTARLSADNGRYVPGTEEYEQQKKKLIEINNWDTGAALRVQSHLAHSESLIHWEKLFPILSEKYSLRLMSGLDNRVYIIQPDGNYFINPVKPQKNLLFNKFGGFTQISGSFFHQKLSISGTIRADKADYFNWKFNPRITLVYAPKEFISFRIAYQSGYRFPSIFEGFSNVNSGGVKRVGGLPVMSSGIFENSYTKASIDAFQTNVTNDINTLNITENEAIEKNKNILRKNPYTYLKPEHVRSFELGIRGLAANKKIFIDADFYYNAYDNFIAQVEASVPKTSISDSIPTYLYDKSKQDRYRMWTNSMSSIYTLGIGMGISWKVNKYFTAISNATLSSLNRTEDKDGLEDGYNTPLWMLNGTLQLENFPKNTEVSITGRYQSQYTYVSFLVSGTVPSFWTLDAQFTCHFPQQSVSVKFGASNLLNKPYYSILGGASTGGLYYISLTFHVKPANSHR